VVGMMAVSGGLGLWMVSQTGWPLLIMGLFSFAVGYFYAGGPRPISALPCGEFFSGFTMGFVIWLIAVYINIVPGALTWSMIGQVFVASLLSQCAIAALLLANNIADEAEDEALHRQTIVHFIGRHHSLQFFWWLYTAGYMALIVSAVAGFLPKTVLLTLLTIPMVYKNIAAFSRNPVKKITFSLAIKNLFIITLAQVVFMAIGVALHF